jgi:hypothetical protein
MGLAQRRQPPPIRRGVHTPAAVLMAVVLAGCAKSDGLFKQAVAPPPPAQIEAGSTFTLKIPLIFGPGSDALYFQDSQLVSPTGIGPNLPYCNLTPGRGSPGRIDPRTFAVQSVEYDDAESGSTAPLQNVTRIHLAANPTQPYTLSCQWPPGAPSRSFLTTEEIEGAIGGQFSMALQR